MIAYPNCGSSYKQQVKRSETFATALRIYANYSRCIIAHNSTISKVTDVLLVKGPKFLSRKLYKMIQIADCSE